MWKWAAVGSGIAVNWKDWNRYQLLLTYCQNFSVAVFAGHLIFQRACVRGSLKKELDALSA